jgi:transcriptional regulator with XRE-family HTH domain
MDSNEMTERLSGNLARNLKWVRERRGLTQASLAKLSDVPRSTVANLETGAGNPTLAVLAKLAGALRLSMEELLSTPRGLGRLYPKGSLPVEERGRESRALVHKLLPDPIPGMEIDRIELGPGARMAGVPHRPGTREYLYCESGQVVLHSAGERFDLAAGDVCAFQGDLPHSYANETVRPAVAFSVVTLAPS